MLGLLEGASAVAGGLGLGSKSGETSSASQYTQTTFTTGSFGGGDSTLILIVAGIVAVILLTRKR